MYYIIIQKYLVAISNHNNVSQLLLKMLCSYILPLRASSYFPQSPPRLDIAVIVCSNHNIYVSLRQLDHIHISCCYHIKGLERGATGLDKIADAWRNGLTKRWTYCYIKAVKRVTSWQGLTQGVLSGMARRNPHC